MCIGKKTSLLLKLFDFLLLSCLDGYLLPLDLMWEKSRRQADDLAGKAKAR